MRACFPSRRGANDGIPTGESCGGAGVNRYRPQTGKIGMCWEQNKDLRRCSYGPISAGIFLLGSPTKRAGERIVEGVADALAVYSRVPGAVLATLGTSQNIEGQKGRFRLAERKKETWVYPDQDNAGSDGTMALAEAVKMKSPDAVIRKMKAGAYGDPGEWAKGTPFIEIDRYDFDEKSGLLYDSGLDWTEADRFAIQFLGNRNKQELP